MATAERAAAARTRAPDALAEPASLSRRWAWPALGAVLLVGLALRLWGIEQGLPYAYNSDEADHFVPRAVAMFGHGLNPHYFANPPAFTYVLHYLFAIAYGGGHGARVALALHPAEVYTLARVAAAVLGVAALWLLYATGARLFGRAVGLLASAIEAVAFLPAFYSHLALNDVPTLAPLTLSLLGTAGVVRKGRTRDYALAGVGLGLACATKYTAGIALVPLVAAVAVRMVDDERAKTVGLGVALAGALAVVAFLVANPYSLLDYSSFHSGLVKQSAQSAQAQGKLGAPRDGGFTYYLWTLTWGLGWAPALAALGGAIAIWRRRPALGWVLVPAPVAFLVFMGLQGRYFGRWLLPIFPLLCLLAAFFVVELAHALTTRLAGGRADAGSAGPGRGLAGRGREEEADRGRAGRRGAIAAAALSGLLVAVVLAQGTVFSVHSGLLLARADTRNIVRGWLVANVASGSKIVAEPVSPDVWARERAGSLPTESNPYRWHKYPSLLSRIAPDGSLLQSGLHVVGIEDYERTLAPALLGYYESHGYCT
ncbi:MAG TPA: glycosyltransferase family 39 protein, partial [Solirubrobacteraceae bacterium]|nr:glycosyltransferase family 39 protein [Solirubrobacteraceae bacterium]